MAPREDGHQWLVVRHEKDFSPLALPPGGGDAFARPGHRLVHISAFQYVKTADVFLGLKVRPVGDEDRAIGGPFIFESAALRSGKHPARLHPPASLLIRLPPLKKNNP